MVKPWIFRRIKEKSVQRDQLVSVPNIPDPFNPIEIPHPVDSNYSLDAARQVRQPGDAVVTAENAKVKQYPRVLRGRERIRQLEHKIEEECIREFTGLSNAQRGAVLKVLSHHAAVKEQTDPSLLEDDDIDEFPIESEQSFNGLSEENARTDDRQIEADLLAEDASTVDLAVLNATANSETDVAHSTAFHLGVGSAGLRTSSKNTSTINPFAKGFLRKGRRLAPAMNGLPSCSSTGATEGGGLITLGENGSNLRNNSGSVRNGKDASNTGRTKRDGTDVERAASPTLHEIREVTRNLQKWMDEVTISTVSMPIHPDAMNAGSIGGTVVQPANYTDLPSLDFEQLLTDVRPATSQANHQLGQNLVVTYDPPEELRHDLETRLNVKIQRPSQSQNTTDKMIGGYGRRDKEMMSSRRKGKFEGVVWEDNLRVENSSFTFKPKEDKKRVHYGAWYVPPRYWNVNMTKTDEKVVGIHKNVERDISASEHLAQMLESRRAQILNGTGSNLAG